MTDSISQYGGFGNRAVTVWQGYGYIETLIRQVCISHTHTHTHLYINTQATDGLRYTLCPRKDKSSIQAEGFIKQASVTDVLMYLKE